MTQHAVPIVPDKTAEIRSITQQAVTLKLKVSNTELRNRIQNGQDPVKNQKRLAAWGKMYQRGIRELTENPEHAAKIIKKIYLNDFNKSPEGQRQHAAARLAAIDLHKSDFMPKEWDEMVTHRSKITLRFARCLSKTKTPT